MFHPIRRRITPITTPTLHVKPHHRLREIEPEALLNRKPILIDKAPIREKLSGRSVLVTGAGGSIGNELCLQLAEVQPQTIVGMDIAENGLLNIQMELERLHPEVTFCAEIGSITNPKRVDEILLRHKPSVIYHAAAYKHVPFMENHIVEAIENNVLGTWQIASMAQKHGAETLVLISTDKAVHPQSIMGATKQVAELLIRCMNSENTNCLAVRFGNVLGSSGSVVEIFKRQIAQGGPVTVTHPEMQRYFMTIPEAAGLVLLASTIGKGGEVFLLDMGRPVKISDLAKRLILLAGLRPDEDIEIRYSDPRPGEKLYEELKTKAETPSTTCHEKILSLGQPKPDCNALAVIKELKGACRSRKHEDAFAILAGLLTESAMPAKADPTDGFEWAMAHDATAIHS